MRWFYVVDGKAVVWCDRLFSNFEIYNLSNFSLRNLANYESVVTRYTPHCLWHSTIKTCFLHQPPTTKDSSLQHINTTTMSNVHGIRSSPALTQSVYPATVVQPVAVAQPRYAVYDKPADRRLRPWILLGSVLLGVCFPLLLILLLSFISWFPSYKHNTSFHYSLSLTLHFFSTHFAHISPFSVWQQQWSSSHSSMKAESTHSGVSLLLAAFLVVLQSLDSSLDLLFVPEQRLWYVSLSLPSLSSLITPKHKLISHQFFWALLGAWIASVAVMIVNGAMLNHYMNDRCNGKNAGLNCQDIREYHTIVYAAFGIPVALWVPTLIVGAYYLWRTSRLMRKEGAAPVAPVVPVGSSTM